MQQSRMTALLALSLAGVLFAGYLSAVKLFQQTCAFNESCPYFLGYPTCYYGFAMFFALAATLVLARFAAIAQKRALAIVLGISGLGIIFAGYFTIGEVPVLFLQGLSAFVLGLPTCAYGLLVYIAIFAIALLARRPVV